MRAVRLVLAALIALTVGVGAAHAEPGKAGRGLGLGLGWDYYGPTGLYSGLAEPLPYILNTSGVSLTFDYDARRAQPAPDPRDPLGGLPKASLVTGARAMVGSVRDHGVEFDAQGWVGYRAGLMALSLTPQLGVGGDGVGLDDSIVDGGFPSAGYWFIALSMSGEHSTQRLDAGYEVSFAHVSRSDDLIGSESRVTGSFSIRGWFAAYYGVFYGGLGIHTFSLGKRI